MMDELPILKALRGPSERLFAERFEAAALIETQMAKINDMTTALHATAAACADHVKTIAAIRKHDPSALVEAAKMAFEFAQEVNNLLTPLKSEWQQEGMWTEYDEKVFQMRPKVTLALDAALAETTP